MEEHSSETISCLFPQCSDDGGTVCLRICVILSSQEELVVQKAPTSGFEYHGRSTLTARAPG